MQMYLAGCSNVVAAAVAVLPRPEHVAPAAAAVALIGRRCGPTARPLVGSGCRRDGRRKAAETIGSGRVARALTMVVAGARLESHRWTVQDDGQT